jgi:hypothetical protein
MESVLALRQPLSDPTWEKPRVIVLVPPLPLLPVDAAFLPHAASDAVAPATATAAVPVMKLRLLNM